MTFRHTLFLILSILCFWCTAFGPPVLTDSDIPTLQITQQQMVAMDTIPGPATLSQVGAYAVLLVNTTTGRVIASRNEFDRRAPASLTKIVTAIVALERGDLEQEIIVELSDTSYVYSAARVNNGEMLTLGELLRILLISSDNSAAKTIARELGDGRRATYVSWMNDKVLDWGLRDTQFGNSHGLDHKDAYTTAWDMAIIAREAMRNPDFREMVREHEDYVAGHWVENTNELLPVYPGMIGVKTGTTDLAGECLIAMVERSSGNALSVVLGSEDRYRDTRLLLDYYYDNFAEVHVDLADTEQNRYLDEGANWRKLCMREPVVLLVSPWQVDTLTYYRRMDDVSVATASSVGEPEGAVTSAGPTELGAPVGALVIHQAGRYLTEVPLYER